MQVLVAGALHLDIIVDAPHLPRRDETVTGSAVAYRMGGKGGNQAVAAARMGAVTAMAGRVGRDGFGARILEALDAAGVDRSRVVAGDGPTGISVAIVEATGEYGAVIVSGVNGTVRADDIELPAGLRVLMLQNEIPEAVNLALARRAAPGTLLVLNAAPARPVARELLARTDVLVVNRIEAAQMTGAAPALPDPAAAARLLRGLGPKAVIVTLGADGLLAATPDGMFTLSAPAVRVVSTHGAGDAFTGALGAALAGGAALADAARLAQAAAALTVASPPDARGAVTADAVRAFLDQSSMP